MNHLKCIKNELGAASVCFREIVLFSKLLYTIILYRRQDCRIFINEFFLPFGSVRFSVDYDDSGRPANLANSAVLKYLEEQEEEKRNAGK